MHFCDFCIILYFYGFSPPAFVVPKLFFACTFLPFWLEREPCVVAGKLSAVRRREFRTSLWFLFQASWNCQDPGSLLFIEGVSVFRRLFFVGVFLRPCIVTSDDSLWIFVPSLFTASSRVRCIVVTNLFIQVHSHISFYIFCSCFVWTCRNMLNVSSFTCTGNIFISVWARQVLCFLEKWRMKFF